MTLKETPQNSTARKPFRCFGTNIFSACQNGCLMMHVAFFTPSGSFRRLSKENNPPEVHRFSTADAFPAWRHMTSAAGFPPSAVQTASMLLLSLGSNQDEIRGGTGTEYKAILLNRWGTGEHVDAVKGLFVYLKCGIRKKN